MVQEEGAVFLMEPWSREESIVASFVYSAQLIRLLTIYRLFLHRKDITLKQFQESSRICGNLPRPVSLAQLLIATKEIRDAIHETEAFSDVLYNVGRDGTIHHAIQVRPSEHRFWNSRLVEPVSDWALSEMMAELQRRSVDAAYKFYRLIEGYFSSSIYSAEGCLKVRFTNSSAPPRPLLSSPSIIASLLLALTSLPTNPPLLEP